MDSSNSKKAKPSSIRARLKFPNERVFIERYAPNISKTGIFVKTQSPKPVGAQIRFEFQIADGTPMLRGAGEVVWNRTKKTSSKPSGMGIKFLGLDAKSKKTLERVLEYKKASIDESLQSSHFTDGPDAAWATDAPSPPQPVAAEPTAEEPATEEPIAEEPATEEPATEEPAAEEIAAEESDVQESDMETTSEKVDQTEEIAAQTADEEEISAVEHLPGTASPKTDDDESSSVPSSSSLRKKRWRTSGAKKEKIDLDDVDSMLADITTPLKIPKAKRIRSRRRSAPPPEALAEANELLESVLAEADAILGDIPSAEETTEPEKQDDEPIAEEAMAQAEAEAEVEAEMETEEIPEEGLEIEQLPVFTLDTEEQSLAETGPSTEEQPEQPPFDAVPELPERFESETNTEAQSETEREAKIDTPLETEEATASPYETDSPPEETTQVVAESDIEAIEDIEELEDFEIVPDSVPPPPAETEEQISFLDVSQESHVETLSFMPAPEQENNSELEAQFLSVLDEESDELDSSVIVLEDTGEPISPLSIPLDLKKKKIALAQATAPAETLDSTDSEDIIEAIDINDDVVILDQNEEVEVEVDDMESINNLLKLDDSEGELERSLGAPEDGADDPVDNLLNQVTSNKLELSITPTDPLLENEEVSKALDNIFGDPVPETHDDVSDSRSDIGAIVSLEDEDVQIKADDIEFTPLSDETTPDADDLADVPPLDEALPQDKPPKKVSFIKKLFKS